MKQATIGANMVNKLPLLIFSRNNDTDYVMIRADDFFRLVGGKDDEDN
jgi:hypothetical protein